jgi:hypothetical protein
MSMDKYSRIRRFRNVLKLRAAGMSFEAMAKRFGLSRQRMFQIHADAVIWSELPRTRKVRSGAQLDGATQEADKTSEADGKARRKRFVGFGRFRLDRK